MTAPPARRPGPKPVWLRRPLGPAGASPRVRACLAAQELRTVCQEARCPNQGECFGRGTAAFLLLGPACTRACAFCAVEKAAPAPPDTGEPLRVARAAAELGLDYCVLTMVSRDDLEDGGAAHVAQAVRAVREHCPGAGVEVLISDLGGDEAALAAVLAAGPQVLNHNLETVPRLYRRVRPQADHRRSLDLLRRARALAPGVMIKSGLMLGLGEEPAEVEAVMQDLLGAGCQALTLGQYLAPSPAHLPVARYATPEEFARLGELALGLGFAAVASGPLVRSSHGAESLFHQARPGL